MTRATQQVTTLTLALALTLASPKRNRSRDPSLLPPTLALAPTLAAGPEDVGEDDGDDDDAATWSANSTRASRGNWSWPGAYNGSTGMRSSTHLDKES